MNKNYKKGVISIDLSRFFLFVVVTGGLISLAIFLMNNDTSYTKSDEVTADLALDCESGKWVEFPIDKSSEKKFQEEAHFTGEVVDADMKKDELADKSKKNIFITHPDYSLFFYGGRKVEIIGNYIKRKNEKKNIYVHKIRCIGEESKNEVKKSRQEIMQHIAQHKEKILALSGHNINVEIDDISFVDDNIVYIDFFNDDSEVEFECLLLLEIKYLNNEFNIKKIAQYDSKNEELQLVSGKDNYINKKKTAYEYDDDLERWVLSW